MIWPQARPFVVAALDRDPACGFLPEDVLNALMGATMRLWVSWNDDARAIEAVVITETLQFPRLKKLSVFLSGGRNIWQWWRPMIDTLERYAADTGCSYIIGGGRDGLRYFAKRVGFVEKSTILEKAL